MQGGVLHENNLQEENGKGEREAPMDDFLFRGRDIAQFGAVAAFGDSMTVGTAIRRSEYELPGGGSLLIGEDAYGPITRTVTVMPADGVTADGAWVRRILAWLTAGRGKLTVKHSPDTYRMAQFDDAGTYGTRAWPLGALQLTCTMQGLAHAAQESRFLAGTQGGQASLTARFDTALPAPARVTLTPTSGTVTKAVLQARGKTLVLEGLNLPAGKTLCYFAGDPLQGEAAFLTAGGEDAYALCTHWAQLSLDSGDVLSVALTGGQGQAALAVRGRWPG